MRQRFHFFQMLVPAGGADNYSSAEGEDGANIFDSGFGSGKVDDRIDVGKVGRGECGCMLVFVDVEGANRVAALAGYLGDQAAGFSFT